MFDHNRDGKVTREELGEVLREISQKSLSALTEQQLQEMLDNTFAMKEKQNQEEAREGRTRRNFKSDPNAF